MNQNCDICQFLKNKPLNDQILTGEYWTVGIIPDQPYLGRAIITLLDHKPSLGTLSKEEWQEFETIVSKLELAYKTAFGAEPLNIGCFMNHGYRDNPPHPHVHWHIFPRYKESYELLGITFSDNRYGNFYNDDMRRPVDDAVVSEIAKQLKDALTKF
jgi:diadenosine tetraphosphate (Ap4A) HIT family hydrolase